jgi:uncharacterized protein (DUF362 family)
MQYPEMFRIRQQFDAPRIDDIPAAVRDEIAKLSPRSTIKPGQTVAISAGSRGIANLAAVIKTIAEEMKDLGAEPFIVPAMGSHGGGTAEGQAGVLAGYGITEETMNTQVRSSMEVVQIGTTDFGMPVYFDKIASQADHVIVVNRVKPHTGFIGEIESGLMKMMLIGLGKHEGAKIYHRAITHHSFDKIVRVVGKMVREKMPIAFGVALLENGYDETAQITAVPSADFEDVEKGLLVKAKAWCPKLPFPEVDLLIIDEMGKDISGSGIDTNVVGRKEEGQPPNVLRIFVRDLTDKTHGNAVGIGMAEFATDRLVEQIDLKSTYINAITGQNVNIAAIPMHFPTDREIIDIALESVGLVEPTETRILWIKNTLDLGEVEASAAFLEAANQRDDLQILSDPRPMDLGEDGNLPLFEHYGQKGRKSQAAAAD